MTFDEFFELIQSPLVEGEGIIRMWRGQSDISWPLHSSAYRRLSLEIKEPNEKKIINYEKNLLQSATHKGFRYLDGRRLSDFDLLARLQHHGAATRLIDATRNVLVGLYFAAASHPKKIGALFGIHSDFVGGYEGMPKEEKYDSAVENLEIYQHPQTWEPTQVSPRIAAQHSQFLYSSVSDSKTGSLWVDNSKGAFLSIAICPSLKRECLKILSDVFDIRHLTLFPDLDGFGSANSHQVGPWDTVRW